MTRRGRRFTLFGNLARETYSTELQHGASLMIHSCVRVGLMFWPSLVKQLTTL